jgi:UDP-N-acetyl-D-galactosamine dehydrogenase
VNVLGLTFKEDCGDLRNSKVIDIVRELQSYGVDVQVCDPQASAHHAEQEYGLKLLPWEALGTADAVVLAVAHREFLGLSAQALGQALRPGGVLIDVKAVLDEAALVQAGFKVWRL